MGNQKKHSGTRKLVTDAVNLWSHTLTLAERQQWNRSSPSYRTGFNSFLAEYMKINR